MSAEDLGTHLHYDEQVAIESYLLRHYAHLLTADDRVALESAYASWWSENLDRMSVWGQRTRVRLVTPPWEPPPVRPEHAQRVEAIVDRLLSEQAAAVRIHRCGVCRKIARGPDDAQCIWCGATDHWLE